eukprot:gene45323-biopygen17865
MKCQYQFLVTASASDFGQQLLPPISKHSTRLHFSLAPRSCCTLLPDWAGASVSGEPSVVDVAVSTTPPAHERTTGALSYLLWRQIGNQVLLKSNICDWVRCDESSSAGSLIQGTNGAVQEGFKKRNCGIDALAHSFLTRSCTMYERAHDRRVLGKRVPLWLHRAGPVPRVAVGWG